MSHPRIALITGANKGIGYETARQLAAEGVHVLIGARSADRGEAAAQVLLTEGFAAGFVHVDLEDPTTFAAAAAQIQAEHGRLDILINNAAILEDEIGCSVEATTMDLWRRTFEINLFAQIELTNALLPLIRASEAGRIVNLSSIVSCMTYHADPKSPIYGAVRPAYDVSKAAVNAWTVHLAYDLRKTPVKVNAVHPGWVKTDMGGEEAPMEIVDGARTSVMMALVGPDGPTGTLSHLGEPLPW
jgi:NAD(P)-dependent dehydrogenase (short-subunit alcohol dehydrogenase family)